MAVNPHEYDREERKAATWWSSRHGSGSAHAESMKQSRRLTLIDVLLLAVIAGLLVPWILRYEAARETAPYKIRLTTGDGGNPDSVVLRVSLAGNKEAVDDSEIVGWVLIDSEGASFHKDSDLAPPPGGVRRFEADSGGRDYVFCEIHLGERTVTRELTMDEP